LRWLRVTLLLLNWSYDVLQKIVALVLLCFTSSLFAFNSFIVKKIDVQGVKKISADAVLDSTSIKVGQKLESDASAAIIQDIFHMGYFNDVVLEREAGTLIIKVVERPTIAGINFAGTKKTKEIEELLEAEGVREGRIYNPTKLLVFKKKLEQYFIGQKRFNVEVSSTIKELSRDRVELEISVQENDLAYIKEIKFIGNEVFSDRVLKRQMHNSTKNWISWYTKSNQYSKEKLDADIEIIKSYYKDRGYINFAINYTQASLSKDKKDVYITISMHEGDLFSFGSAKLSGKFVVDKAKLESKINKNIKPGNYFAEREVWRTKEELEQVMGEYGYGKADVRVIHSVDEANKRVNLEYIVAPRKRIMVRNINFEGNVLTKDEVLRREVEQSEGTWISTKELREGREAIMRRGYSRNVDIITDYVADRDDLVDVLFKMEEQKTSDLSAGLSFSKSTGISGQIAAQVRNFLGTGRDISIKAQKNKAMRVFSFNYQDPYFTRYGTGFGVSIFNKRTNLSKISDVYDYITDSSGFGLNYQHRLAKYLTLKYGITYSVTDLTLNDSRVPAEIILFSRSYNNDLYFHEFVFNTGVFYNSLDSYMLPSKGLFASSDLTFSLPISDINWYKVELKYNWFYPILTENLVFNFKSDLALIETYGDSRNRLFPFFKHYYIGGMDTVRGFEERSLGPQNTGGRPFGGNAFVLLRAQLLFPPPMFGDARNVRCSLFVDAGQVYHTHNNYTYEVFDPNPTGLKYSAGISVTWHTPFGIPFVLSYARPLNEETGDKTEYFAFSLGASFF